MKDEVESISVVQTIQQTACATGYLQEMVFKVEKIESLNILGMKCFLHKKIKPRIVTLISGEIQRKRFARVQRMHLHPLHSLQCQSSDELGRHSLGL